MDCLPQLHLAAIHAPAGTYQSATPGLGALCRDGVWLAGAGALRNSLGRDSVYLMAGAQTDTPVRVGVVIGAISGYRDQPLPFAAVAVSYGNVHLTIIPPVRGVVPGRRLPLAIGVSITFP